MGLVLFLIWLVTHQSRWRLSVLVRWQHSSPDGYRATTTCPLYWHARQHSPRLWAPAPHEGIQRQNSHCSLQEGIRDRLASIDYTTDTCGLVRLTGDNFRRVRKSDPLAQAVIENHFGWFEACKDWEFLKAYDPQVESSVLYDTVAVYMAFSEALLAMEPHLIIVTDDARTLIDDRNVGTLRT